jgi:hypothetical protein
MTRVGGPTSPVTPQIVEKPLSPATAKTSEAAAAGPPGGALPIRDSYEWAKSPSGIFDLPRGVPSAAPQQVGDGGDGFQSIPATSLKGYAYDKVADKIMDGLKKMAPELDAKYPPLTPEQQAIHDAGSDVAKVKEYVEYAQVLAEMAKHAKDGPTKQKLEGALKKLGGNLDALASNLEKGAKALGKVSSYATLAVDTLKAYDAVKDLRASIPGDFKDGAAVEKFAKALSKTSDAAQSFFVRGRDLLFAAGKAGAGVTFAFFSGMASIGIKGLEAGVGNVNKYIARMEGMMKQIENGGVAEKLPDLPPPPEPAQTYGDLRLAEFMERQGKVREQVAHGFDQARAAVKADFQERHKGVRESFDAQQFPQLVREARADVLKELAAREQALIRKHNPEGRLNDQTAAQFNAERAVLRQKMDQIRGGDLSDPRFFLRQLGRDLQPPLASVKQLESRYAAGLDQAYEQKGLGAGALQKEYAAHGLTPEAQAKLTEQMLAKYQLTGDDYARSAAGETRK